MRCLLSKKAWIAPLASLLLLAPGPQTLAQSPAPLDLEAVREAAAAFVAEALALEKGDIHIPALDRRARAPACSEPIAFRWPFSSKETVEAFCPTGDTRLFLRVMVKAGIDSIAPMPNGPQGWQAAKGGAVGDVLQGDDLQPARGASPSAPAFRGPKPEGTFRLKVLTPIEPGETIPASAVRLERKVLRAEAALAAKLRLPHPQLKERWVPAEGLAGDTLSPEDLPSLVALARPLRAGSILRSSDLSSAVLVQKGGTVRVAIHQGLLVLEVDLIAEEDGALGESIVVLNPDSGRRLRAMVTGPGQAEHAP